jgi:hypothetical protein
MFMYFSQACRPSVNIHAGHLSIFELFRNMEPEFREEICSIVEYIAVPQGNTPAL